MRHDKIVGCTRTLGEAQGYDVLHIRDDLLEYNYPSMTSAWRPTKEELEILNNGGQIFLTVLGTQHPPVALRVE